MQFLYFQHAIELISFDSKTIWIYTNLHNLTCNQQNHDIKPKVAIVKILNSDRTCNLPINHCETCDEYYIGKNSLSIMQKEFGVLLAKTHGCTPAQSSDVCFTDFKMESDLHSCGYNVIAGELSIFERRNLLAHLIDNSIMSKFAIRRDIETVEDFLAIYYHFKFVKRMTNSQKTK